MRTDHISLIEARIRQKASYEHSQQVKAAMKKLTEGCYYGNNKVPHLTLRVEEEQEDGTVKITHRAPTIIEVGDLLAQAIADHSKNVVETRAVNEFIARNP